jgi:hypothetical protein
MKHAASKNIEAYNEPDLSRKQELLDGSFSADGVFISENQELGFDGVLDSWHTEGRHEHLVGSDGAPPSYEYNGDDPWIWDITIEASDSGGAVTHHNAGPSSVVLRYVGVAMKWTPAHPDPHISVAGSGTPPAI